jgi:hypothetical protein
MQILSDKCFWKSLYTRKSQSDTLSLPGNIIGSEKVIPEAEGESEIHPVFSFFWKVVSMMPDVHLGVVEYIFQIAYIPFDIRMVEMPYRQGKNMDDEKVAQPNPDQGKWDILQGTVYYVFHPVKP